ncbi:MAG: hypothetical protein ACOYMA_04035 [Bacteroidia bacterium]
MHDSSITKLNTEKEDIREFIETKKLILERLDFTSNTNKSFVSIIFDFAERFGFLSVVNIENTLRRNELYLGKRRDAAKLYLLNIRNNKDYINRFNDICLLLESSLETEEDTDKDVVVTFLNYYAKVVYDTSLEYSEAIKRNLVDARINSTFKFLQGEYLTKLLEIDIANSDSAYQSIHTLIDEIYERQYALEEVVTEEAEYLIEANTDYSNSLENIELSFDAIRNIAVRKCRGIETHLAGRGVTPLREENELYVYLLRYGKMHKAKLESCFNEFPFAEINQPIEVIDWGCGQGLASLVLCDYLKSNELHIPVSKIILIEPSPLSIKRAALHLQTYPSLQTAKTICKSFDVLEFSDLSTDANTIKIHLFSNVLDIDDSYYSQSNLIKLIKQTQKGINYFICCSPYITDFKTEKINNFVRSFGDRKMMLTKDNRKGEWNDTDWSRVVRVFKVTI